MPQFVERQIGEGDVFLEDRAVTGPFRISMPENELVISQTQEFGVEAPRGRLGLSIVVTLFRVGASVSKQGSDRERFVIAKPLVLLRGERALPPLVRWK